MTYANIREILGHLIGKKLLEITQHDESDVAEGKDNFIELMFENGHTLKVFLLDDVMYVAGACMSFSDPSDKDDDGLYHPDADDMRLRKWAVVAENSDLGRMDHVIPCFGKLHYIGEICWCKPTKEFREDRSWFFNHHKEP